MVAARAAGLRRRRRAQLPRSHDGRTACADACSSSDWRSRAVAIAFVASRPAATAFARRPGRARRRRPGRAERRPNALELSFVYSPEKEQLLAPLIKRFNASGTRSGGRPVFVDAQDRRLRRRRDADRRRQAASRSLWSPASSFWGRLLNYEADRRLVADENPSIVRTPLVIAMWKQLARRLRLPAARARLRGARPSSRTGGWAAVGKPQFGRVQVRPHQPGLLDLGPLGGRRLLLRGGRQERRADRGRRRARARAGLRDLERSIVHYGDTTLFIADEMRAARARLRVGGGDGGDDADRLQPPRGRRRAARRRLSRGGDVLLRQPADHARRATG